MFNRRLKSELAEARALAQYWMDQAEACDASAQEADKALESARKSNAYLRDQLAKERIELAAIKQAQIERSRKGGLALAAKRRADL